MLRRRSWSLLLIAVLAGSAWMPLAFASRSHAQEQPAREIRVHGADFTQRARFPNICLQVAPLSAAGQLPDALGPTSLRIYEDGERRAVTAVERRYVGAQIAFVLDASGSFKAQSLVNKDRTRVGDAVEAIDELVLTTNWLKRGQNLDEMMVIAPTGRQSLAVVQPWTEKYNAVHNAAYSTKPVDRDSPLYKMLSEGLKRMTDAPDYRTRAKFLVVLSDGVDNTSAQEGTDVILAADRLGVKILSILIGPPGQAKTLRRLAEETGGGTRGDWAYTAYQGPASLVPLYSAIKSQAEPYIVCYRSKINNAGQHNLEIGVKTDDQEVRSAPFPVSVPVKPARVTVTDPAPDSEVIREAPSYDADLTEVEPRGLPVTAQLVWQDGFERSIEEVTYEVDGKAVDTVEGALAQFTWDVSPYRETAMHSLRVLVRDELGIESKSEPVNINVQVVIPPAPDIAQVASTVPPVKEQPLIYVGLAVGLLAIVVAGFALLRRKPASAPVAPAPLVAQDDADKDPTIPFRPQFGDLARGARAYLIPLLDSANTPGDPIPIRLQTVHIGRNPAQSQIVFSNPTVSRLHARLVEESDDVFVLHDEGGSSGTYVNGVQVDPKSMRQLKDGDIIQLGQQRVRFQAAKSMQGRPGVGAFERDDTEVWSPEIKK